MPRERDLFLKYTAVPMVLERERERERERALEYPPGKKKKESPRKVTEMGCSQ
jgi:hypothetical protein